MRKKNHPKKAKNTRNKKTTGKRNKPKVQHEKKQQPWKNVSLINIVLSAQRVCFHMFLLHSGNSCGIGQTKQQKQDVAKAFDSFSRPPTTHT